MILKFCVWVVNQLTSNQRDTFTFGCIEKIMPSLPLGSPPFSEDPGEGSGYLLQYTCLDTSTDRGAQRASVHGIERVRRD